MNRLQALLTSENVTAPRSVGDARALADMIGTATGLAVYPKSIIGCGRLVYWLGRKEEQKYIGMTSKNALPPRWTRCIPEKPTRDALGMLSAACPVSHEAVRQLAVDLDWLRARTVGLARSFGLGDRLGLATPGHVRAIAGSGVVPFFAQQSIREMSRTRRTPEDVMTDAVVGAFQEGFRDGFGSDADHLKSIEDADRCAAAGFTLYTVDSGDHVDDDDRDKPETLARKFDSLPWAELETTPGDCRRDFVGRAFRPSDGISLTFNEETLVRAAVKYGRAVAHAAKMYRHLAAKLSLDAFELEVSVDETATPTTVAEHFYVARELTRLGVKWVGLAPRFVGRFEKGVDYQGSLEEFERTFAGHAAIAASPELGPYKISLHSGSDKFSVYPIVARLACELVHVKTAGTSYLEALRVIAQVEPGLFREILAFAHSRYGVDKATYHVSADPARVPQADQPADEELPTLLDQFDARQMLHVTYGSVLTADDGERYGGRLMEVLKSSEERYAETLETHLGRHVAPFARSPQT